MKKWLIALVVLLILTAISVYLFIPDTIKLSRTLSFPANKQGVNRSLFDKNQWPKWWPVQNSGASINGTAVSLSYNGRKYEINDNQLVSLVIPVSGNVTAKTTLNIIPLSLDSLKLSWEGVMITSYNPVSRLQAYFNSKKLEDDMGTILEKMHSFFVAPENMYGLNIRQEKVIDSFLVSTTVISKEYPSTSSVYALVDLLKKHIAAQSGEVTGYPMMNVSTTDSAEYTMQVAIPVNRNLAPGPNIIDKKMIAGAKILTTEVTGGPGAIYDASRQIELFINDYHLTVPAIPFYSLVTDRSKEADTSRWITKIVYPVM